MPRRTRNNSLSDVFAAADTINAAATTAEARQGTSVAPATPPPSPVNRMTAMDALLLTRLAAWASSRNVCPICGDAGGSQHAPECMLADYNARQRSVVLPGEET